MRSQQDNDLALVERLRRGDERAFEDFFGEYFDRLYRFVLPRVAGNDDAAEEVVQAALCKATEKLHTFEGRAPLFSWLCTFCRHEISRHLGRAGRKTPALLDDLPQVRSALEKFWSDACLPEDELLEQELVRQVHVVLDHLPDHYSNALEWKYVDGLSVSEIAHRLGLGDKAAESLLTRARGAFRAGFSALAKALGPKPQEAR